MLFVQFNDNWADEMYIRGGKIMTEKEYEEYLAAAKKAFEVNKKEAFCFYVGTNEYIEYENFKDFTDTLTVYTITEKEEVVLKRFNLENYGIFPDYYCYNDDEEE